VVNDLITSIEAGMLEAGIEVISWEKLKALAADRPETKEQTTDNGYSPLSKDESELNLALSVSQIQDLDAIVEIRMRYAFESYGGDITVSAVSARAVQPVTGKILWVIDNGSMSMEFSRAKKVFIADVLKIIQNPAR
jgi:hypothetical protein